MIDAGSHGVRKEQIQIDTGAAVIPSLPVLARALREAIAASEGHGSNTQHAQAALLFVEDAATRISSGKRAVMTSMRQAAQHLRAVQQVTSEPEKQAFAQARRLMTESMFEASDLPG